MCNKVDRKCHLFFLIFHVPRIWLGHVSDKEAEANRCTDNCRVYVFGERLSIHSFILGHILPDGQMFYSLFVALCAVIQTGNGSI